MPRNNFGNRVTENFKTTETSQKSEVRLFEDSSSSLILVETLASRVVVLVVDILKRNNAKEMTLRRCDSRFILQYPPLTI